MLDSGSDDGGSSPFGCTKYGVNTNKIVVFQKVLYKSIIQLKPFTITADGFLFECNVGIRTKKDKKIV